MTKLASSISIYFIPFDLYEIHGIVWDGHFYVFQQDVRVYAGNFTYALRLQMVVGNRLNDTKFPNKEFFLVRICLLFAQCISFWKKLKKIDFASDGHYWEGSLNFKFSSVKEFELWWHNFLPKCWNMITLTL